MLLRPLRDVRQAADGCSDGQQQKMPQPTAHIFSQTPASGQAASSAQLVSDHTLANVHHPAAQQPQTRRRRQLQTTAAGSRQMQSQNASVSSAPFSQGAIHRPLATSTRTNTATSLAASTAAGAAAASNLAGSAAAQAALHAQDLKADMHIAQPLAAAAEQPGRSSDETLLTAVRKSRSDSLAQGLVCTAVRWAEAAVNISDELIDAYELAQIYFQNSEYQRAVMLLERSHLHEASLWGKCLSAQCKIKLFLFHDVTKDLAFDSIVSRTRSDQPAFKELDLRLSEARNGGASIDALLYYHCGVAHVELAQTQFAIRAFRRAISADMRCIQAFDALIHHSLLPRSEILSLINDLRSRAADRVDRRLVHILIQARAAQLDNTLSSPETIRIAASTLHPKLSTFTDLRLFEANDHFNRANVERAYRITSEILSSDPFEQSCIPLHIACLYETKRKNDLFILSHALFERFPRSHLPPYAVGVYYILAGKYDQASSYLQQASSIKSDFFPAWIAIGHSASLENEHEKAISSYSSVVRTHANLHLPKLFIGMEHMLENNLLIAKLYLEDAYQICNTDPLLLNELGVLHYRRGEYAQSIRHLERATTLLRQSRAPISYWNAVFINLGHAYRATGNYPSARMCFTHVVTTTPRNAHACAALGLIEHTYNNLDRAIELYLKAISLDPTDAVTSALLEHALADAHLSNSANGSLDRLITMNNAHREQFSENNSYHPDTDRFDMHSQQGFGVLAAHANQTDPHNHAQSATQNASGPSHPNFHPSRPFGNALSAVSQTAIEPSDSADSDEPLEDESVPTAPSTRPRTRLAVQRGLRSPYDVNPASQGARGQTTTRNRLFERMHPRRRLQSALHAATLSTPVTELDTVGQSVDAQEFVSAESVAAVSGAYAAVSNTDAHANSSAARYTASGRMNALRNRKSVSTDDGMSPLAVPMPLGAPDDARLRAFGATATPVVANAAGPSTETLDAADRASRYLQDTATPPPQNSSRYLNFASSIMLSMPPAVATNDNASQDTVSNESDSVCGQTQSCFDEVFTDNPQPQVNVFPEKHGAGSSVYRKIFGRHPDSEDDVHGAVSMEIDMDEPNAGASSSQTPAVVPRPRRR